MADVRSGVTVREVVGTRLLHERRLAGLFDFGRKSGSVQFTLSHFRPAFADYTSELGLIVALCVCVCSLCESSRPHNYNVRPYYLE